MSRLVLVEECPDALDRREGDTVVAVTPRAAYELRSREEDHRLMTDLYSEDALRECEDGFWNEQLAWFDLIDDQLTDEKPDLAARGMRPACLYGYHLKLFVDIVFIRAFELRSALDACDADEVVLWRADRRERPLGPTRLMFSGPSVYSRLLPLLCAQAGVRHEDRVLPAAGPSGRQDTPPPGLRAWLRSRAVSVRRALRTARLRRDASERPLTLLMMKAEYDLRHLIDAALAAGHRCLLRDGGSIVDLSSRLPRRVARLKPSEPDAGWAAAANRLAREDSPVWDWPDAWFGVRVAELLGPRLRYWAATVVPSLLEQAGQLEELYRREQVDGVLAPHLTDVADFAAMDAARADGGVERFHIEHGATFWDAAAWDLMNLFHFDHYFVPTEEWAAYSRARAARYSRPVADVHVGSYTWRATPRPRSRGSAPPDGVPTSRPIVVYPVTIMAGDVRYLNIPRYPDPWYYALQAAIVDRFAEDERYTFIVKSFPGGDHIPNPIERYVRDVGAPHVRVSVQRFPDWLPWADRVLIDYPSTAVYETARAGVPFLALVNDRLRVRSSAVERMRPWVAHFREIEDALPAISAFLDEERLPRPALEPEGGDVLAQLERLAGRAELRGTG